MSRSRHVSRFSRRHMLMGLFGVSAATAVGGIGGLAWLIAQGTQQRQQAPTQIVQIVPYGGATAVNTDALGAFVPEIVRRDVWGALPPDLSAPNENGVYSALNPFGWRIYDVPLPDIYRTVVVHHSVEYVENDWDTLLEIQRLHRDDRGWADVGYHFFVGKTGTVFEGRTIQARGTHVGGYNTGSVGVCLLGNFMDATPTPAQINSAQRLIQQLKVWLQLSHIAKHSDFNDDTVCPGDNLADNVDQFAQSAGLVTGTGGYNSF